MMWCAILYDSQFGANVDDVSKYIKFGKIGEAFLSEEQVVLLIDEIDKADLEFPNDLLWEMDQMEFYVQETKETIRAKHRPIVIITSNAEKELPDAFLRRCIFHYIEFPALSQMKEIIHAHFGDIDQEILQQAVLTFYNIRRVQESVKEAQHLGIGRLAAALPGRRRGSVRCFVRALPGSPHQKKTRIMTRCGSSCATDRQFLWENMDIDQDNFSGK